MQYVLGVDGGASKTHALLVEETGKVLGFGGAGTANHQVRGLGPALREIELAITRCHEDAGMHAKSDLGMFCLAGADLPEDYRMLYEALSSRNLTSRLIVKNDTLAALRSGLSRSWGVVVVCGTGFNAAGRGRDAQEIVLPGLGSISGDWGGGSALSQEMIRLVMRAWDGRCSPTLLTDLILEDLEAYSEQELLSRLYHGEIGGDRLLSLVPLLFDAAEMGDAASRELIVRMGNEVAVTALALIRRLDLLATDVEVVLAGSVFKGKGDLLIDTVSDLIRQEAPKAQVIKPKFAPVLGAVLLALEALGTSVNERTQRALRATMPASLAVEP